MSKRQPIPLSRPDIGPEEKAAVLRVLDSGQLSLGPFVGEFEHAIAAKIGTSEAIAVSSGTSALHLCVKAASIEPGDEVITTPFSFVASANCILFEGGVPKFVDIDPVTYNIDPAQIESAITPRTKAILPVHVFGRPCQMDVIATIATRHGLTIIEDACEAIGARFFGRHAGSFGQTGVFAFYPNKQMTTGEGGVIVTSDSRIASLCRSWRNQGRGEDHSWLIHERIGYNYRLSDIQCALGIVQLSRLDDILRMRARVAASYTERLRHAVPEVLPPAVTQPETDLSWFTYVVRLHDAFSEADRDAVIRYLREAGIGCNNYFTPIHLQTHFREQFGYNHGDFPITEHVAARTIALPFFNTITESQIDRVVETLKDAFRALHNIRSQQSVAVTVPE